MSMATELDEGQAPRGYRLYLTADRDTGQRITLVLLGGHARDARLTYVLVRHLLGRRPAVLAADWGLIR